MSGCAERAVPSLPRCKRKLCCLGLLLFVLLFCTACGSRCEQESDENRFTLFCDPLNGERSAQLVLDEGDSILVRIEKESGRLDLSVAGEGGEKIYTAHDADTGEFILEAPPGAYTVNVQGKHAKGSLSFEVQKAP